MKNENLTYLIEKRDKQIQNNCVSKVQKDIKRNGVER